MITLLETESGRLLDVARRRRCFCGARRSRLSPVVAESRVVGGRRRRITVFVALERRLEKVSVRLEGVGEGSFRVVDVVGTSAIRVFIYVVVRFE